MARALSRVAVTRRMTKDLPEAFDDLRSAALLYAAIADDEAERASDRIKATQAGQAALDEISSRIAIEARREVSWISSPPRAV